MEPAIIDRLVTAEELLERPEWEHCELVRGKIIFMSPSNARHGQIAIRITRRLIGYVDANDAGELFAAETGFLLERNPDTVRAPDVMFVSKARMPAGGIKSEWLPILPDLAVEIVSPSDRFSDVTAKAESYTAAGVRLVWVVDPQTQRAYVFSPGQSVETIALEGELNGADVLPGFSLALKDIFNQ